MGEEKEKGSSRNTGQDQCGSLDEAAVVATAALARSLGEKFFEARVAAGMTYAPGWWVLTEGERAEHEKGALSFAASLSHDETATAVIQASEARANRAEEALRGVLEIPDIAKMLEYHRRGIGTKSAPGLRLQAALDALNPDKEAEAHG